MRILSFTIFYPVTSNAWSSEFIGLAKDISRAKHCPLGFVPAFVTYRVMYQ